MDLEFSITLSIEDLKVARRWHRDQTGEDGPPTVIMAGSFLLIVGVPLLALGETVFAAVALTLAAVYLWAGLNQIRSERKSTQTSPSIGKTMHWSFADSGMEVATEGVSSKFNWSKIHSTKFTPDGALLYLDRKQYFWFPFAQLSDEERTKLKDIIRAATAEKRFAS